MTSEVRKTSPVFFGIILLCSLILSLLLTDKMPHDLVSLLIVALSWLGTVALVWTRWKQAGAAWLARIATGIGAAIVFTIGYQWTSQTDVFIIPEQCGCKAHAGTFWSLIFLWIGGGGLLAYTLMGNVLNYRALLSPISPKGAVWWLSAAIWTAVCIYILENNATLEVLLESLRVAGIVIGAIAAFFGGIAALVFAISYPSRRRAKRMRAEFEKIDEETRRGIVELVDHHARQHEFLLYYLPGDSQGADAQIGGNPLAFSDEHWPKQKDGTPALFLLQLPLHAPRLPAPWQGRIITVYMQDWGLVVRSYSATDAARLSVMPNPQEGQAVVHQGLHAIAIPYVPPVADDDEEEYSFCTDANKIIERIPELKDRLEPFTSHHSEALAWILSGCKSAAYYGTALGEGIQVGGNPEFIQGEHEPRCEICQQPMRFLFQFEDVFGDEYLLGDAGVGYVYGCDAHPEHCQGFVDCC